MNEKPVIRIYTSLEGIKCSYETVNQNIINRLNELTQLIVAKHRTFSILNKTLIAFFLEGYIDLDSECFEVNELCFYKGSKSESKTSLCNYMRYLAVLAKMKNISDYKFNYKVISEIKIEVTSEMEDIIETLETLIERDFKHFFEDEITEGYKTVEDLLSKGLPVDTFQNKYEELRGKRG